MCSDAGCDMFGNRPYINIKMGVVLNVHFHIYNLKLVSSNLAVIPTKSANPIFENDIISYITI